MTNIVILDSKTLGDDIDTSVFDALGSITEYQLTRADEVFTRIRDAEVIITNKVILDATNLPHAKNLKLIALLATGYNNVDLNYCKEHQIAVVNVAGYSTESVAQQTFSSLFYLTSTLRYYDTYVKSGAYVKSDTYWHFHGPWHEIAGKQWGIIGLGLIGKSVAKKAEAFGCQVKYFSTSGQNTCADYESLSLESLLRTSDIVSIHAPLNAATKALIGATELQMMKPTAILINMGRGGIVDESALAQALDQDEIAAAALDVLVNEPILADNPLLHIKNPDKLFITPHIAWASIEARTRLVDEVCRNVTAYFQGEQRNRIV